MNSIPEKKDDILKKIITSDLQEPVPVNFTNDVLKRLNISGASAPVKAEPIIPFQGWIIVAVIISLIVYISSDGSKSAETSNSFVSIQLQNFFNMVQSAFNNSHFMYYVSLMSLAVLTIVIIESFYRKMRVSVP